MCISKFITIIGVLLVLMVVAPVAVVAAPGDVAGEIAAPCKYPSGLASDLIRDLHVECFSCAAASAVRFGRHSTVN